MGRSSGDKGIQGCGWEKADARGERTGQIRSTQCELSPRNDNQVARGIEEMATSKLVRTTNSDRVDAKFGRRDVPDWRARSARQGPALEMSPVPNPVSSRLLLLPGGRPDSHHADCPFYNVQFVSFRPRKPIEILVVGFLGLKMFGQQF